MKRLSRILVLSLVMALAITALGVVIAQDSELPGPGQGGIIIRGNERGSGNLGSLIWFQCGGVDCADVNGLMWPGLIGLNPETQNYAEGQPGAIAESWAISDDGLTITIKIREGLTWNDGTPITANDVFFGWAALRSGDLAAVSGSYRVAASFVTSAEVIDDYTIAFGFDEANCDAVGNASAMAPLPSHIFGFTGDVDAFDFSSMVNHPYAKEPAVTAGPFNFTRVEPGTAVYLLANQEYKDAYDGFVRPTGFVYLDTPDRNVMVERFLAFQAGDINYLAEPDAVHFPRIEASGAQFLNAPGRIWHYVALNLADPSNPQPGRDEDGNLIDQGQHPLFGNKLVRQALQHAMNINDIIDGPLNGNATAMVAGTIPTAYTLHPNLERRAYDVEAARALLDEAGWISTGEPLVAGGDGLRTCQGCGTAAEGTPFEFTIMNIGDVRNQVAIILQDQYAEIGVKVNVQVLDFNTMYTDQMGAQIYDAAVAGWRGALPFDPDQRAFFGSDNDILVDGFNFPSYQNAEVDALFDAIATGDCSPEAIIANAHRVQEILWDEQPYLWLYAFNSMYAAAPNIANFQPFPSFGAWNIDQWAVLQ